MTRAKAIDKIMSDLSLPKTCESIVLQMYGELTGSSDSVDNLTVEAIKASIRKRIIR